MRKLMDAPPFTPIEPVMDILHEVPVTDPYRWLEEQSSPRTRKWIAEQTACTRTYLDSLPARDRIQKRVAELLSVGTIDSLQKVGSQYFFRKRSATQEQFCICMRDGPEGEDQILVDPAAFGTGNFTAVQICMISPDARLLAYQVRQGGEDCHRVEFLDVNTRTHLPDNLPRGFLWGFAFSPDNSGFYYVHQASSSQHPHYRAVLHHVMGNDAKNDREIFFAGEDTGLHVSIRADAARLGIVALKNSGPPTTDLHIYDLKSNLMRPLLKSIEGIYSPFLANGRTFVFTENGSPNGRIAELLSGPDGVVRWKEIVPERPARIINFSVVGDRLFVAYLEKFATVVHTFDLDGCYIGDLQFPATQTIRILAQVPYSDELLYQSESFTQRRRFHRYIPATRQHKPWSQSETSNESQELMPIHDSYRSSDGTRVPIYMVGEKPVLNAKATRPVILTSYGGFGAAMTPQFSIFTTWMMEHGCIFALPNIRGGCELGADWHLAAKRRNRQKAFDDFIAAAEWLIQGGVTTPKKLAIFGGSNSGLLVGAAITQRPDLFQACLCIAPLLDMVRYHLFDDAAKWTEEFGCADNVDDFKALYAYSPYHNVRDGVGYPATLIISGDADTRCNPMHARKMVARLQAASSSPYPILLDYRPQRGHVPVLPLSERINAMTDRLCFLSHALELNA